jgi:hypothetical protein
MPSWKAWAQTPSGLIKMGEESQAVEGEKLALGQVCFEEPNIHKRSKLKLDSSIEMISP